MKLSERQCGNCGLVDSIHVRDLATSKLVEAVGPKDSSGLQQYLVYCRECNHMTINIPGWFGNHKLKEVLSPMNIMVKYGFLRAQVKYETAVGVPRHIQLEMLERLDSALDEDNISSEEK